MKFLKKFMYLIFLLSIVTFIFLIIFKPIYILREDERAIIMRLGKVIRIEENAGLKFLIPIFENLKIFPNKILRWNGASQKVSTASQENQLIWIEGYARWKIKDLQTFYRAIKTIKKARTTISSIIEPAIIGIIAKYPLIELIRTSNTEKTKLTEIDNIVNDKSEEYIINFGREKIEEEILKIANENISENGIEIVDFMIKNISYDDALLNAVEKRMIAERKQIAAEERSLGEASREKILGAISRERQKILSLANLEVAKIKGEGEREAAIIYNEAYSKSPEFYKFWKALNSYKEILKNKKKIFSTDMDYFNFLHKID